MKENNTKMYTKDQLVARQLFGNDVADNYPEFNRTYPNVEIDQTYISSLPDLQNGPESLIKGSKAVIEHVGISNFILPVKFWMKNPDSDGNNIIKLETSVTGSVSLEAEKKGINMSRIMRTFYEYSKNIFSLDLIENVLDAYKDNLDSHDARIMMRLRYPMIIKSLRSSLSGYQYYNIALEVIKDSSNKITKIIHLDYVYSSTCPCSLELSEHARQYRRQIATPHSQRSVARISVECVGNDLLWFEDLVNLCRIAIPTETQVMVKREDEQAFAELNGSNPIFVEDAVRLFFNSLSSEQRIGDFRVIASHLESLHSHDAIAIITRGNLFRQSSYDPHTFSSLYHIG